MWGQVDGSLEVVTCPACGFSPDALTTALLLWPRVTHLTLLAVGDLGTAGHDGAGTPDEPHRAPDVQAAAPRALALLAANHAQNQAIIGAIPALVRLLGFNLTADVQAAATGAMRNLTQNQTTIVDIGAIWALVRLLGFNSLAVVQTAAARALANLAGGHAGNQTAITGAG
ncbi:hypothetical protein FOA52_002292 [Chlamydomonas sp. UWO 241]|nr:hypothetical protein FOA52_002292 [Chlamydomonas sp. UWO 241]